MTSESLLQMENELSELIDYTNKVYTENHLRTLTDLASKIATKRIITERDFRVLESIRQECRMMLKVGENEWMKEKYFYLLCESDHLLESMFLRDLISMNMYLWNHCFSLLAREIAGFILRDQLESLEHILGFFHNTHTHLLEFLKFYKPLTKVDGEKLVEIGAKLLAKDFECFKKIIQLVLREYFYKEVDLKWWFTFGDFCERLRQTDIMQEDVPLKRETLASLVANFAYSAIRKHDYVGLLEAAGNIGFAASILEKKLDEKLYLEPLTDYLNGIHTVLSHFAGAIKDLKQF